VGLKRFWKKNLNSHSYLITKLFRVLLDYSEKFFLASLDPQILCLLMTYPGHIRLFIYFFFFKITFFSKKNLIQILKNFWSNQEFFGVIKNFSEYYWITSKKFWSIIGLLQKFFGVLLDYSKTFLEYYWITPKNFRSNIGLLWKILSYFISSLVMKGKTDILKKKNWKFFGVVLDYSKNFSE